jgi:hypothetical protein
MDSIVRLVARYLRDNPLASDTAEGIAHWWLPAGTTNGETLQQALSHLIALGAVEAVNASDGKVRYRRATGGAEIDALLDGVLTEKAGSDGNHSIH